MSLSESAIEAAINVGGAILERFISPPKKRQYKELISDDLVSIGLATGYFFNFLDMTAKTIQYTGGLDIYSSTNDNKPDTQSKATHFDKENIKVEIILPKRLHGDNFATCEQEFTQYKRGFFYSQANGRYYGINYALMETNNNSILRIIDYARPVTAAKPFYEQIRMIATEAEDKWEKTQVAEIAAFKKTLNTLLNRSYGTLSNKLSYMDIG